MKAYVFKTSDGLGVEGEIKEFGTLEELIKFARAQSNPVIIEGHAAHGADFSLEIYDAHRE